MSGRTSKVKGANYEREIAEVFRDAFPDAKRGIGQARSASEVADVEGTPFWIECKHRKAENPRAALNQAVLAQLAAGAKHKGKVPIVVSRVPGTREDELVSDIVTMRLEDFLALLET